MHRGGKAGNLNRWPDALDFGRDTFFQFQLFSSLDSEHHERISFDANQSIEHRPTLLEQFGPHSN